MQKIPKLAILLLFALALESLMPNVGQAQQFREVGPFSEENPPATCRSGYAVAGIRCSGRYCDNKTLICRLYASRDQSARYEWSQRFSEEKPGEMIDHRRFVTGIACSGRYCDNLQLQYMQSRNLLTSSATCDWTGRPFSEEEKPRSEDRCDDNGFVAGVRCSGRYCDNLELFCCQRR